MSFLFVEEFGGGAELIRNSHNPSLIFFKEGARAVLKACQI